MTKNTNASIQLLFFASLGERLGCDSESYPITSDQLTLGELKHALAQRGETWQTAILSSNTRCAVNQSIANNETVIQQNDEIAFFPPVTGG